MARKSADIKRRDVLQKISQGAALGSISIFAHPVASQGREPGPTFEQLSSNVGVRRSIVSKYAMSVLKELADMSIIDKPSISEFDLETFHQGKTKLTAFDEWEGSALSSTLGKVSLAESNREGDTGPMLLVSKHTSSHHIRLFIRTVSEDSYSIVDHKETNKQNFIASDEDIGVNPSEMDDLVSNNNVDTSDITTSATECPDFYICGDRCKEVAGNCYWGDVKLYTQHQYECSVAFSNPDCTCIEIGTSCGGGDCWEMC